MMKNHLIVSILAGLIIVLFCFRVHLSVHRLFATDELEHLHSAWCVSQGEIIYKDFFEHHPPLFYFTLVPLYYFFEGTTLLVTARLVMMIFVALIFLFVYLITTHLKNRAAGIFAVFLVSTTVLFLQKSLEVRPDVPALMFLLAAVLWMIPGTNKKPFWDFLAGVSMTLSLLYTPKTLFPLLGLLLAVVIISGSGREILKRFLWFSFGASIPAVTFLIYFLSHDALEQAFFYNCTFNTMISYQHQWQNFSSSFLSSFKANPLFWCLSLGALTSVLFKLRRKFRGKKRNGVVKESIIAACTLGTMLGLLVLQVPLRQYLMILVTLLAIVLAGEFFNLIEELQYRAGHTWSSRFAALLICVLAMQPIVSFSNEHKTLNDRQLEILQYVWNICDEEDSVFDCWTGLYVFRPHAFFYHFLGPDIYPTLIKMDKNILQRDLLDALQEQKPKIVIKDRLFAELPVRVQQYIHGNYQPGKYSFIWQRREKKTDRVDKVTMKVESLGNK